jgi:hypothetical protein
MKKNVLAMSIAAMIGGLGLAGGASAAVLGGSTADQFEINKDGKGHILLVPYYNASEGMSTIINLVNSDTVNGKVLKVRFRGANNSDDVFDFTLFMSPGDVWSGAVVNSNGSAALQTNDNSCVLPDDVNINKNVPVPFVTGRLAKDGAAANLKGTLEGYVEVLNMADIPLNTSKGTLYSATKHKADGSVDCFTGADYTVLRDSLATTPADAAAATAMGLSNPSGQLFANWTIINVNQVSAWGGAATAVEAQVSTTGKSGTGNIVFFPQKNSAYTGVIAEVTADPLLVQNKVVPAMYDLPDLSTPYLAGNLNNPVSQADTLTASLAATAVQNEYITSSSVVGSTDWVFSMPTRRYHVALDYNAVTVPPALAPEYRVFRTAPHLASAYFTTGNTKVDSSAARIDAAGERSICVDLGTGALTYRDRSERAPSGGGFVISPSQPAPGMSLCGEASVLSFNSTGSQVLGATIGQNNIALNAGFNSGWASISTTGATALGLPILGSAFQKYLNKDGETILGNFGSVYPHRFVRP